MRTRDLFISVVVPCHNAANGIGGALFDLTEVLKKNFTYYEVVIVDDGSTDETVPKILALLSKQDGLRLVRLSVNRGTDVAVSAGLDSAIGDFVVVMDPLIEPPDLIPELISQCQKKPGIYFGVTAKGSLMRRSVRPIRTLLSHIFDWYCRRFLKVDIQRKSLLFRVFSRQAVNIFTQMGDRSRILRLVTANLGLPTYRFEYTPLGQVGLMPPRGFNEDINLAFDILVSTSQHPLRLVSRLGLFLAMINIIYALYVVSIFIFKTHVAEGWLTLSLQSSAMFFFLFLVLAVLGEYVGKSVFENQDRPLYSVLDEHTSSVLIDEESRRNIVEESLLENYV